MTSSAPHACRGAGHGVEIRYEFRHLAEDGFRHTTLHTCVCVFLLVVLKQMKDEKERREREDMK
jgi:hypothetical protein